MNKLSNRAALIALLFLLASASLAFGQDTRTTSSGSRDASIQTATTSNLPPQTDARARPTPTPVAPVRPLSQEDRQRQEAASARRRQEAATGDPDVLLDVPNLSVDEITLEVENLRARVSLDARLANLLQLTAGADAGIDKVKLTIKGVRAEVLLKVRLDNVAAIIDRTLTTIDRNPQILERLLQSVDTTVGTVGGVANTALGPGGAVSNLTAPNGLLAQTVNTLGQTVQRTVDRAGNIVERTLDTAGKVVDQKTVGNVSSLSVLGETTNNAGQTLRRVTDTSGAVIELTLDAAGKVVNSRVVSQATGNK